MNEIATKHNISAEDVNRVIDSVGKLAAMCVRILEQTAAALCRLVKMLLPFIRSLHRFVAINYLPGKHYAMFVSSKKQRVRKKYRDMAWERFCSEYNLD